MLWLRRIAILLIVALVYIAMGKLGLRMAFLNLSASPVWPPSGIALAALLLFGSWVWPSVLLGAFVVNITTAGTVWTSLGIAAGNTLEAVLGAFLIVRLARGREAFFRPQDVFRFAVLSGVATAVSATI